MKNLIAFPLIIVFTCLISCKKETSVIKVSLPADTSTLTVLSDKRDTTLLLSKGDPNHTDHVPTVVNLTIVILYSDHVFNFSWSYQYIINPHGGGTYYVAPPSYTVGGSAGQSVTKFPTTYSITGNVVHFTIKTWFNNLIPVPMHGEPVDTYDETVILVDYNMVTGVYSYFPSNTKGHVH